MKVTRYNPITMKKEVRDFPITREQIHEWCKGVPFYKAFPKLTKDEDRDFITRGFLPEEWKDESRNEYTDFNY